MYLGFGSNQVWYDDGHRASLERRVYSHNFQEEGSQHTTGGPMEKYQVSPKAEGKGKTWAGIFTVLFTGRNGKAKLPV